VSHVAKFNQSSRSADIEQQKAHHDSGPIEQLQRRFDEFAAHSGHSGRVPETLWQLR